MSIFRRRPLPPRQPQRWWPRTRSRYLPAVTPPADKAIDPGVGAITITGHAPRVAIIDADIPEDTSRELCFVHQVVLPAYTYYHPTIPELEGIPIEVGSVSFTIGTKPLVGIQALIIDPGLVRQAVFASGRSPGLVAPSYGDAVYVNVGGQFEGLLLGVPTDGAKVTCWHGSVGGTFPDDFTVDYIAYIDGTPRFTKTTATVRLRDRSRMFDARIATQGFGNPLTDSAGTRTRPIVYGTPGYLSPILHQPFEVGNVWFLQLNTPLSLDGVYDGGVQLINQGEAMSISDLMSGSAPNPSSYRYFSSTGNTGDFLENEGTWLRLGSKVRVDLRYYADSGSATISELAIDAGIAEAGTMAADSVDLDVGSRAIEPQRCRDVLEDVARANLSIIGFDRADTFMQRYLLPSHEEDYDTDVTFVDGVNSKQWEVYAASGLDRRVWEVRVNAGATQQGQLAGIPDLDGGAAEAIRREQWLTSFVGSHADLLADDPSAESMTLDIEANHFAGDEPAMQAFAERVLDLFGSIHVCTWLTAQYDAETAALQLMDRVALSGARMTTGKRGRIISIERNLRARRIRFGVWTHYSTIPSSVVELTSIDDATVASSSALSRGSKIIRSPESQVVACGNPNTLITAAGLLQDEPDFPYDIALVTITAALSAAQEAGSTLQIDVRADGVSLLSAPLTIDNGTKKSTSSATQPTLTKTEIKAGQSVSIHAVQVGNGTAAGLKVNLVGYQ